MVECENFLTSQSGVTYKLYTIKNTSGAYVQVTDIGAAIVSICVPDKSGILQDVALSYSTAQGFESGSEYFGATVGRCCNRIKGGKFALNGKQYSLAVNNPPNHLHGGIKSFSRRIWQLESAQGNSVKFSLFSPDGEEGYPADMTAFAKFTFDDGNKLTIEYSATAAEDTLCNMTNHTYFNLNGHGSGKITDHVLCINADGYVPVDSGLIPCSGIQSVVDTPFDFRKEKPIGTDISSNDGQITIAKGYDQSFAINGQNAAYVYSKQSGIKMECTTTCPALQLYTANYVDVPPQRAKGGMRYGPRSGFCLEAQGFPDAINQPCFPSVILKKGQKYFSVTKFIFSLLY